MIRANCLNSIEGGSDLEWARHFLLVCCQSPLAVFADTSPGVSRSALVGTVATSPGAIGLHRCPVHRVVAQMQQLCTLSRCEAVCQLVAVLATQPGAIEAHPVSV